MNTQTTISISEARRRIFEIAEEVQKPNKYYILTEKGRPKAVVMSAEDFESWQETLEVIKDFPDLDKDVKEARRAFQSGEYKNWTTLDELLKKHGCILDKDKKNKNVSTKNKAKSRK